MYFSIEVVSMSLWCNFYLMDGFKMKTSFRFSIRMSKIVDELYAFIFYVKQKNLDNLTFSMKNLKDKLLFLLNLENTHKLFLLFFYINL